MPLKNTIVRVLFIIICAAFAGGAVYYLIVLENEKMELQEEMRQLVVSKQGLASVVTYLEESKNSLDRKVKEAEKRAKRFEVERDEEKSKSVKLAGGIQEKEAELKRIEGNIADYQKEKKKMIRHLKLLNSAFEEIKVEYDKVATEKEKTEREIEDLDRVVKDLSKRDATSLGTVVIR